MKKELVILPDGYARRTAIFVLFIVAIITLLLWHGGISGLNAVAAFSFTALIAAQNPKLVEQKTSTVQVGAT